MAESAIELVPNEIAGHPAILSWAHRKRKDPKTLVLDQSYHHAAVERLGRSGFGRGRPDIAHFSLLLALGSPLSMQGGLRCYVHTVGNRVIKVDPRARLPRNSDRWTSLLEQLFVEKVVPPMGPALLTLTDGSIESLVGELKGDIVIALTTEGESKPMEFVAKRLAEHKKPTLLVGGFHEGHFSKRTMQLTDECYRIDRRKLEASTVVARAVYDYERALVDKRPQN